MLQRNRESRRERRMARTREQRGIGEALKTTRDRWLQEGEGTGPPVDVHPSPTLLPLRLYTALPLHLVSLFPFPCFSSPACLHHYCLPIPFSLAPKPLESSLTPALLEPMLLSSRLSDQFQAKIHVIHT